MKKSCILCNKQFVPKKSYDVTCDKCLKTLCEKKGKL